MCFFNEELLLNLKTCFIKIFVFIYRAKLIDSAESLKFKNDFQENSNGGHGHRSVKKSNIGPPGYWPAALLDMSSFAGISSMLLGSTILRNL